LPTSQDKSAADERIGDSASLDAGSAKTQADKARLTALVEILKHPVA
jgi:hypothetical protein